MKTGRIRGFVTAVAALVAALATALVPMGSASAEGYEHSFTGTVDKVLVNRYGGITVSGTMDCSAEVAAIYGGEENIPADTTVFVSKSWVATQYVGRGKVVTARYDSGIASMCFNNNPVFSDAMSAPWPWATLYAYPVGETQWVYSSTGKFGAGAIHVELTLEGVPLVVEVGADTYDTHYFYDFSGWNLRATKVR